MKVEVAAAYQFTSACIYIDSLRTNIEATTAEVMQPLFTSSDLDDQIIPIIIY